MKKDILKMVAAFVGGAAIGGTVGYFLTKKRSEMYYAEMAAQDIHEVKEHYRLLRKETVDLDKMNEELEDRADDIAKFQKLLDEYKYSVNAEDVFSMMNGQPLGDIVKFFENLGINIPDEDATEEQEEDEDETFPDEITNIFNEPEPNPYSDEEEYIESVAKRDPDEPYVIHVNEYMDPENSNDKFTVTYYEGDETLVDDTEKVVPDVERLIGPDALTMFGKFSEDHNIVYVRNDRTGLDFEIIKDERGYVESIMNVPKEPLRKMRGDD